MAGRKAKRKKCIGRNKKMSREAGAGRTVSEKAIGYLYGLESVGEEKATVRYVRHPLGDEVHDEIKSHLAAGKLPTKLALTWDDRVSFVLTDTLHIKRIAFLDIVKEQAEQDGETTMEEQFDADFALMTGELSKFVLEMINAIGGEVKESA